MSILDTLSGLADSNWANLGMGAISAGLGFYGNNQQLKQQQDLINYNKALNERAQAERAQQMALANAQQAELAKLAGTPVDPSAIYALLDKARGTGATDAMLAWGQERGVSGRGAYWMDQLGQAAGTEHEKMMEYAVQMASAQRQMELAAKQGAIPQAGVTGSGYNAMGVPSVSASNPLGALTNYLTLAQLTKAQKAAKEQAQAPGQAISFAGNPQYGITKPSLDMGTVVENPQSFYPWDDYSSDEEDLRSMAPR
jgi:hypothetical protein